MGHPSGSSDVERFDELYGLRHHLRRFLVRRGADHWTAEEVTHEVFVVAWRRLADIPEGEAARRWLYGVARRLLGNARRGAQRRAALLARLAHHAPSEQAVSSQVEELRSSLVEAWSSLTLQERHVLWLVVARGLGRNELALVLGCSPAAAAMRLSRARARLEAAMEEVAS